LLAYVNELKSIPKLLNDMASKIFVNLHVKDLKKSMDFFGKLGYQFNLQFTDEKAACMVISEDIYVMLLMEPYFKGFTKKEIPDTSKSAEAIIALSADGKKQVDELADKALKAGATQIGEPQDHGFMYTRMFQDLDGHLWETFWMDASAANPQ
jgi:uncharacterized protein